MTDQNEQSRNFDLVMAVAGEIEVRLEDPDSLDSLTEAEADILAVVTADGVIGNGGFAYWYEGKTVADTLRVAAALDRIGLANIGQIMRASLEHLPENSGDLGREELSEFVDDNRDDLEAKFKSLDRVIWRADLNGALAQYIKKQRSKLEAANPGIRALAIV